MKHIILIISLLAATTLSNAQLKAVTEKGEKVFLYDDGTWKYENVKIESNKEISTNS